MRESRLERLQRAVFELLRDRRELERVTVLSCRSGDFSGLIQAAVRESIGLCATVLPPFPLAFRANCPCPCDGTVAVPVRVSEDVAAREPMGAVAVAEFIHCFLVGRKILEGSPYGVLLPKTAGSWQVKENFPAETRLEILLTFETFLSFPAVEEGIFSGGDDDTFCGKRGWR